MTLTKKNMKSPKQIKKSKSCGLLHANDVLENFMDSNVINVEPKSTKLNEPILEGVELDQLHSLRNHFYPSRASPRSYFDFSLYL